MTPEQAQRFFAVHHTLYVLAQFVDIHAAGIKASPT
jgi:hypothetical protein